MTAELIVPDLEGCTLKPYVSYATKDIYQDELTSHVQFIGGLYPGYAANDIVFTTYWLLQKKWGSEKNRKNKFLGRKKWDVVIHFFIFTSVSFSKLR